MFLDLPTPAQIDLQDPASAAAIELVKLNQTITVYLILILTAVAWFCISNILTAMGAFAEYEHSYAAMHRRWIISFLRKVEAPLLEIIWTITPGIALALSLFHL